MSGVTSDISVGGLYVATENAPDTESAVDLSFVLPGEDTPIMVKGRVAWGNGTSSRRKPQYPPGFGVEFTDIDPDAASFIQAFVDGTPFEP